MLIVSPLVYQREGAGPSLATHITERAVTMELATIELPEGSRMANHNSQCGGLPEPIRFLKSSVACRDATAFASLMGPRCLTFVGLSWCDGTLCGEFAGGHCPRQRTPTTSATRLLGLVLVPRVTSGHKPIRANTNQGRPPIPCLWGQLSSVGARTCFCQTERQRLNRNVQEYYKAGGRGLVGTLSRSVTNWEA
jgi:hypothetical protein